MNPPWSSEIMEYWIGGVEEGLCGSQPESKDGTDQKGGLTAREEEFNHGRRNYSDGYRHSFVGCDFLELLAVGKPAHSRSEDVAFDCHHFRFGKRPVAAISQIERISVQKAWGIFRIILQVHWLSGEPRASVRRDQALRSGLLF